MVDFLNLIPPPRLQTLASLGLDPPLLSRRPLKKSLIFFTMKRPSNIFKIKASRIDYTKFVSNKSGIG